MVTAKLDSTGRLVVPARQREAAGIRAGDTVTIRVEDGELRISTVASAVRRAQNYFREHVKLKPGERLSESLLQDRRKEAAND